MASVSLNEALPSLDFSGKRVLVTGGGRGIGKAIAVKFLELNATVVVLDKEEELLNALTTEYPAVTPLLVDLKDWDATRVAVESVLPIHHLANNAGIVPTMNFLDIDLNHIDDVFSVNFKAALNVAQVVAKGMISHGIKNGTIVNTTSLLDTFAFPSQGVYGAFKAALKMLTKTMAVELAPHGIRVNAVSPGLVDTELVANMPEDYKDRVYGPFLQRQLFHRFIKPQEIANAFVYLSSPLSSSVTGTSLSVDQGYHVQ